MSPAYTVAAARRFFHAGEYDRALRKLEFFEQWPPEDLVAAVLIRAEILTRRDPVASLKELTRWQDRFVTPALRFEYFVASGRACSNVRDFDGAAALFRNARTMAAAAGRRGVARVAYQEARLRWMRGDYDPHCSELVEALTDPTPIGQAAALALRAWMHGGIEQYDEQIAGFRSALALAFEHPENRDVASVGLLIHSLLAAAVELGDAEAMRCGREAYERLLWTNDTRADQFLCARALGWDAFLSGELVRAQEIFNDAARLAPTSAWQVTAHLDRAQVAYSIGNEPWALEELLRAHEIAERVRWDRTRGEERTALVRLASLFADKDQRLARVYVDTYTTIGMENVSPTLALGKERRALAHRQYAAGRLQQVLGNESLACEYLASAYTVFEATRKHYQAALTADALHDATEDPLWAERARAQAAHFPNCPLPQRLRGDERFSDERYQKLTPFQRQLLHANGRGLSIPQMSARFCRSSFTLRRQLDQICVVYAARNPRELRVKTRRRVGD
jgi:tetratricopeptide (TPR) repeat protein